MDDKKIKAISIQKDAKILDALKQMDQSTKKLLLVFDGIEFLGLLSIGDIQRAIINNTDLNGSLTGILRKKITLSYSTESFDVIKQRMLEYRTECMPVIDTDGNLSDVYFWEDVFIDKEKSKSQIKRLPVLIMAGGQGTRLRPMTNVLPKPLIPLGEKTIIEEIMDRFCEVGCNDFFLSVNYKAEIIKHYFETLNNPDYNIEYFQEDQPLGTAGSLFLLKNKIATTFFVSNCDILIDQDISEIYDYHNRNKNELTMVAALKHYNIPYGTVETVEDGLLDTISEKPEIVFKINTGFYILEPHLLNEIPENEFFHITELIEKIKKRGGKVGVFPISEKSWTDIGDWKEYLGLINLKQND
ncbi:nucleotidyltransferase family protein [Saccharicrinis sp. FJH54]|uniref:nucleotidyltransferase family protein n=1 Tax=Saccharicrinis sp. FJH54 TaxID=3344665 RepID=UPI0035D4C6E2